MLRSTLDAVKAICAADPSINAAQVKAAIAELSGEGVREMRGDPLPRAYSVAQVAELTGKSRRTISLYAKRGLLTPIYSGATGKRAQAYTGASVAALLSGKAKAKGSGVAA